jgi:hypothetical protein
MPRHFLPTGIIMLGTLSLSGCTSGAAIESSPGERLSGTLELHLVRAQAAAAEDAYFRAIVDFDSLTWREIDRTQYLPSGIPGVRPRDEANREQPLRYDFDGAALRLELWVDREVQRYAEPTRRERITYTIEGRFRRREGRDLFGPFRGSAMVTGGVPLEEVRQIFRGEAIGYCLSGGSMAGCLRVYSGH